MNMVDKNPDPGHRVPDFELPLVAPVHGAILFAIIAAFGLYQALTLEVNCDVVILLHEAGRLLDGARLYVDIMEINPPLIVYMNLPVAAAARVIGGSQQALFPIFAFALILCSLALCNRLRSCLPAGLGQAAMLLLAFVLLVVVGGMFGQREHLMLALILPYAFAAASIADGGKIPRALACGTGVMAGIGFALKPYFLPAFLGVELYLALRRGRAVWVRPQALGAWVFFVAYAMVLLVVTPEYLPFIWSFRNTYRSYHPHGDDLLWKLSWIPGLLVLSVAVATSLVRRRAKGWSDVLCLIGIVLTAGVYIQAKGHLYHWYPTFAIAIVLLGVAATALAVGFARSWRWANGEIVLALLIPAACAVTVLFWSAAFSSSRDIELDRVVREHARGGSIYGMSSLTHPLCIAGRNGAGFATNHYCLLPVQSYYGASEWRPGGYHAWDRMPAGERELLSRVVADLERERPALLLFDKLPPGPELIGFDFLDYFRREPRFARLMAGYRHLADFKQFRVYELDATRGKTRPKLAAAH